MKKCKKKPYEPPVSTCTRVELECAICNGSREVEMGKTEGHEITDHKVNSDFTGNNTFTSEDWK